MNQISNYQLYLLTIFFQVGTNIVFGFGTVSGRDSWISTIISTVCALLIIIIYIKLMKINSGLTLIQWWPKQFGKWIGVPIAWMYVILLVYQISREVGDLKFLISMTILPKTPYFIVISIFLILVSYTVYAGIETIARLAQVLFWIIILLVISEITFVYASHIMNFNNLLPIGGKGWKTIEKGIWPIGILTFGETIELGMIWPLVKKPKRIMLVTYLSSITFCIFLVMLDIIGVMVLGEAVFKNSFFPLYTLIKQINLGEFITNLDAIGVLFLLTNIFFRISIYMFGAINGMRQLTFVKSSNVFIIPTVAIVIPWGLTMASSLPEHIDVATSYFYYNCSIPFFIILPCILLGVSLVRKKLYDNI